MADSLLISDSIRSGQLVRPESTLPHRFTKRVFDVFVSLALLSTLFPLMLLIALAIRLSSRGPAIYTQKRLTEGGRAFTIYKFRTMSTDGLRSSIFTTKNDPRVTSLGSFLRRTRLDELPQLINVCIGDMSLIGPRPELPSVHQQLAEQLPSMDLRLKAKAGLSGLAQVESGYAGDTQSYREKLRWDLAYIEHQSLRLDLEIALKTVLVVVSGKGSR